MLQNFLANLNTLRLVERMSTRPDVTVGSPSEHSNVKLECLGRGERAVIRLRLADNTIELTERCTSLTLHPDLDPRDVGIHTKPVDPPGPASDRPPGNLWAQTGTLRISGRRLARGRTPSATSALDGSRHRGSLALPPPPRELGPSQALAAWAPAGSRFAGLRAPG